MQDILDSGFNLNSFGSNLHSRSNNNIKNNKKQTKPLSKAQSQNISASRDQFDNLLTSMLNKQSKHFIANEPNGQLAQNFTDKDKFAKTSPKNPMQPRMSLDNSSTIEQFAREESVSKQFGKTQQSILNPSKTAESFVSTRNMKPPLRPKDTGQSYNFFGSSAGITIPQEDPTLTNSSNENYNRSISLRKRSSIDVRSQLSDDVFPLASRPSTAMHSHSFDSSKEHSHSFDSGKEDAFPNIHKSESYVMPQSKPESFFKARDKLQMKSQLLKMEEEEQKSKGAYGQNASKQVIAQYQKQIDMLKNTYQKQISHLQQCLDKQITENQSLRATFLQQSNKILEEERTRSARIHEEEINRLKDIFGWQSKKQQDTYQMEITSLKASLELVTKQQDWFKTTPQLSQQALETLQYRLQSKEQSYEHKLKLIEQREFQLLSRQSEVSVRIKNQQGKIRQNEKRLMQMEMEFKKYMLDEKKMLSQEKQQLAIESSNLEADLMKQKEQMVFSQKEIEIEREALEKQRESMQIINSEAMVKHRVNLMENQGQRERLKQQELELMKKLRVVQMTAKELSYQSNNHQEFLSKKHNNWLDVSHNQSLEKQLHNSKSMNNMIKTKQRFHALQSNAKSKLNLSVKENKKIDLGRYISRMEQQRHNLQL